MPTSGMNINIVGPDEAHRVEGSSFKNRSKIEDGTDGTEESSILGKFEIFIPDLKIETIDTLVKIFGPFGLKE